MEGLLQFSTRNTIFLIVSDYYNLVIFNPLVR